MLMILSQYLKCLIFNMCINTVWIILAINIVVIVNAGIF